MAEKFKVGEVVVLKSTGPDMTVKRSHTLTNGTNSYTCQWFAGKKLEEGTFAEESLEPAPVKKSSSEK